MCKAYLVFYVSNNIQWSQQKSNQTRKTKIARPIYYQTHSFKSLRTREIFRMMTRDAVVNTGKTWSTMNPGESEKI